MLSSKVDTRNAEYTCLWIKSSWLTLTVAGQSWTAHLHAQHIKKKKWKGCNEEYKRQQSQTTARKYPIKHNEKILLSNVSKHWNSLLKKSSAISISHDFQIWLGKILNDKISPCHYLYFEHSIELNGIRGLLSTYIF